MNTPANHNAARRKKVSNSGLFRALRGMPVEGAKKKRKKKGLPTQAYNSSILASTLALVIAGLSSVAARLLLHTTLQLTLLTAALSFAIAVAVLFIALEYFIFSEIKALYGVLENIKKKDFKQVKKTLKGVSPYHPIRKLNNEIFSFASRKEQEIVQLKALELYRKEFLADVSHELKTPIFAAQGFIHTLLDGAMDDPEVADKFLRRAATSLDGLVDLVGDLIMVSQLEIGAIQMHLQVVEMGSLVTDVLEQLEHKADRKHITMRLERKPEKPVLVLADKPRMRQVMTNLVDNAIKYGKEGGVVTVGFDPDKEHVVIQVKDDGPGIPQEHLGRIFERFYVVEKSRSKEMGGSGLGLAIVKHILEAHHSKITVTSKPNKGSTFSFKLKRIKPEALKNGNGLAVNTTPGAQPRNGVGGPGAGSPSGPSLPPANWQLPE